MVGFFSSPFVLWGIPIVIGAGVAAFFILRMRSQNMAFEVQRKSKILSPAEKGFFECLINALDQDFYIFAKVAVLDVVEAIPAISKSQAKALRKRLQGECFDYVMCKKHDLSIFGVVELENFEKRSSGRTGHSREGLVSAVCKAAHLRLFYFDIRQDYHGVDIRRLVTGRTGKAHKEVDNSAGQATQVTIDNTSYAAYAKQRACPQCNGEVVTKVAVKGKNLGEKFLMCRKYPYCDYRMAINDPKIVSMERHATKQKKKPGFSDWSAG